MHSMETVKKLLTNIVTDRKTTGLGLAALAAWLVAHPHLDYPTILIGIQSFGLFLAKDK